MWYERASIGKPVFYSSHYTTFDRQCLVDHSVFLSIIGWTSLHFVFLFGCRKDSSVLHNLAAFFHSRHSGRLIVKLMLSVILTCSASLSWSNAMSSSFLASASTYLTQTDTGASKGGASSVIRVEYIRWTNASTVHIIKYIYHQCY